MRTRIVLSQLRQRAALRRSRLAAALLLTSLVAGSCGPGTPAQSAAEVAPALRGDPAALLKIAPADLPNAVRERYRLRPDRRLLAAIAEIDRVVLGGAGVVPTVRLVSNRWEFRVDDEELGVVAEFPGFEEGTDLLVSRARRLLGRAGSTPEASKLPARESIAQLRTALDALDLPAMLHRLSALQATQVARATDESIPGVVSSLVWISLMTPDELDQSDALLATAWAWHAVARARGFDGEHASEALLAWALGYEAAAAAASASLSPEDPIRLFVLGRQAELDALAERRAESRPVRLLSMAMLVEREQHERFGAAAARFEPSEPGDLALLGFAARISDFDRGPTPGEELAAAAFRGAQECLDVAASPPPTRIEGRTVEFETAVERCADQFRQSPLGAAAVAAFYRSAFYTGLYEEARFFVERLTSAPAARQYAAAIGQPAPGVADELRRWTLAQAASISDRRNVAPLVELLDSAESLGADVLHRVGIEIARNKVSWADPARRPIATLFARLDTRPSHRLAAARLARDCVRSAWHYEQFAGAAVEVAPHRSEELPAFVAWYRSDSARLRQIAVDPAMPPYAQRNALLSLARLSRADDDFLRDRYAVLARESESGVSAQLRFLEERPDLEGALEAAMAALERKPRPEGLMRAFLLSEAARFKRLLGDPNGAWELVRPAISTGKEDAFIEGAAAQLARGEPREALLLALRCTERYPASSEGSGLLARARWRLGDYATAANELAANRNGIFDVGFKFFREAFIGEFGTAPREARESAFTAMLTAGVAPETLAYLAGALAREHLDAALPLLDLLPSLPKGSRIQVAAKVHDLVREQSGAEAANAWYRARHTRSHADAVVFFQERRFEQILALFPDGDESQSPAIVRLLKAASLLHLGETSGPRWDELSAAVRKDWGNKDYFLLAARYLMGQVEAAELLSILRDVDGLASIGWAMGLKAASERRFEDADAWLQVAIESGRSNQPPFAWAVIIENHWSAEGRSLELLQHDGIF